MKKSLLKPSNNSAFLRKKNKNQLFTVLRPRFQIFLKTKKDQQGLPPVKPGCCLRWASPWTPHNQQPHLGPRASWPETRPEGEAQLRTFLGKAPWKSSMFALPSHLHACVSVSMAGTGLRSGVPHELWELCGSPTPGQCTAPQQCLRGKCIQERAKNNSKEWGRKTWKMALKAEQKEEGDKVIPLQPVEQKPHAWAEVHFLQLWLI